LNIAVTGYATLARGGSEAETVLGNKLDIFNEPILVELAKKYNKTVAQIVLNSFVTRNIIVIPKSVRKERL